MENIPVTLQYPERDVQWDLSLPVDIPINLLLPKIIEKNCGTNDLKIATWQIRILDSGDYIKPDQTLISVGILPGDILVIQASFGDVPDFSKTQVLGNANAFLISPQKSFPLSKKIILIGRLDKQNGIFPDIDLSPLDTKNKVSRSHAQILNQKNSYFVRDFESKNGTIVNGKKLVPSDRQELKNGDIIQFGTDGVIVKFQKNS